MAARSTVRSSATRGAFGLAWLLCAAAGLAQVKKPTVPASFVAKKPPPSTQTSKSIAERGGNPCNTPDPGFGIYDKWTRGIDMGQLVMPTSKRFARGGQFDVVFHFHGHEAARKEWITVMDGAVLVGIDLGLGSGPYETAFDPPDAFARLVTSVERAVEKKTGRPAKARKIGLSAWSAGYGAVQKVLGQKYGKERVDAVVLLDGLHCGYQGQSVNALQIRAFTEFAKEAAAKRKLMFVSHSSIIPPGYASTTETASFLIHEVGGTAKVSSGKGPLGMDLISRYTQGNFHVRGFSGNDKMDHCAHLSLYRDVLKIHLKPRWNTPRVTAP
ncbi:MAG: uncharacterized protein K0R38_2468 [Polyangiaceae bacterium]|jgi:hypothetical protein|nr:uncharacterized protein [Polyangiaceae bacterium]